MDQCEAIAEGLCDEALDMGSRYPFVIEFLDECGTFAELMVGEDEGDWRWFNPNDSGQWQFEGSSLTAVLRSGARRPLQRFFQMRWASEDGEWPLRIIP